MEIRELAWDPANLGELAVHGVARREVDQVVDRDLYVVDVHPDDPDQVRVTGPTAAGRLLTIALEPVDEAGGLRRPITGWEATRAEEAYYRREQR